MWDNLPRAKWILSITTRVPWQAARAQSLGPCVLGVPADDVMLGASPSTGSGPGGGCVSVSPTDDVMLGRHPAQAQALVVDVFQCPC